MRLAAIRLSSLLLLLSVQILVGCDQQSVIRKLGSAKDQAVAKQYIDAIRQGDFGLVEAHSEGGADKEQASQSLATLRGYFPEQQPLSTKAVGDNVVHHPDGTYTRKVIWEYEFPSQWFIVEIDTSQHPEGMLISGINITPMASSLEDQNRFNRPGKGPSQLVTLFLAIFVVAFTVYAFVRCLQTRMNRWKWLWLVLIPFGVGQFAVNWTTGETSLYLLAFHIPPVGAFAVLYGPWEVYLSLPIVAIAFLALRKSLEIDGPIAPPQPDGPPTPIAGPPSPPAPADPPG